MKNEALGEALLHYQSHVGEFCLNLDKEFAALDLQPEVFPEDFRGTLQVLRKQFRALPGSSVVRTLSLSFFFFLIRTLYVFTAEGPGSIPGQGIKA